MTSIKDKHYRETIKNRKKFKLQNKSTKNNTGLGIISYSGKTEIQTHTLSCRVASQVKSMINCAMMRIYVCKYLKLNVKKGDKNHK